MHMHTDMQSYTNRQTDTLTLLLAGLLSMTRDEAPFLLNNPLSLYHLISCDPNHDNLTCSVFVLACYHDHHQSYQLHRHHHVQ